MRSVPSMKPNAPACSGGSGEKDKSKLYLPNSAPMPKHIPFPDYNAGSELLNELLICLFNITAATMQFINIYRTNWWMADSLVQHKINLHRIDVRVIFLIFLMVNRRVLYSVLQRLLNQFESKKRLQLNRSIANYAFGFIWLTLFVVYSFLIYRDHSVILLFFLCYPVLVYTLIFGFNIEPFFRTYFEIEGAYFNGMPFHSCSTNPVNIREEIDTLRCDFNRRFKQVIYTSMVNAYYTGFVPCFVVPAIQYNFIWIAQHIIFIWLADFMMCSVFVFPAKYCDILHRASLHLGYWQKVATPRDKPSTTSASSATTFSQNNIITPNTVTVNWNKNIIWTENNVIKYNNDFYRSCGPCTVATPGNPSHSRFYQLFHNPEQIYLVLTYMQATNILAQILLLFFAIEWHFILSVAFIAFTNYFTFFKILRDYLITKRIYGTESSYAEKHID